MISYLEGKLISKTEKYIVLLINGVGYKVFMPIESIKKIQQPDGVVKVFTYLNVREDALDIYGFLNEMEKELFELFITVSGVGPKVALTVVSLGKPEELAGAILKEDVGFLTSVAGIGTKIAKKIIVELKDKVIGLSFGASESGYFSSDTEAVEALSALGWSRRDIREALNRVSPEIKEPEARVKEALKMLGKS
jgi:holliday junction DNA helicase RuvA